jgi:hypothetical protein
MHNKERAFKTRSSSFAKKDISHQNNLEKMEDGVFFVNHTSGQVSNGERIGFQSDDFILVQNPTTYNVIDIIKLCACKNSADLKFCLPQFYC